MEFHTCHCHIRHDGKSKMRGHGLWFLKRTPIVLKLPSPNHKNWVRIFALPNHYNFKTWSLCLMLWAKLDDIDSKPMKIHSNISCVLYRVCQNCLYWLRFFHSSFTLSFTLSLRQPWLAWTKGIEHAADGNAMDGIRGEVSWCNTDDAWAHALLYLLQHIIQKEAGHSVRGELEHHRSRS